MTSILKRLAIVAICLLGAVAAWPFLELVVGAQGLFPSYFLYSASAGAVAGIALGAFFGSAEGLLSRSRGKILAGLGFGALAGLAGGLLGALLAQSLVLALGERILKATGGVAGIGMAAVLASGWILIGAAIGAGEGLRARSFRKVVLGLAGGAAGGAAGGLCFAFVSFAFPESGAGRLIALCVLGTATGFSYSILERRFAPGALKVLNGPLKGREFLVNQKKLSLGSATGCDIVLHGYRGIEASHLRLISKRGELWMEKPEKPALVNDKASAGGMLKLDDVIQVGSAKLLYGYFG